MKDVLIRAGSDGTSYTALKVDESAALALLQRLVILALSADRESDASDPKVTDIIDLMKTGGNSINDYARATALKMSLSYVCSSALEKADSKDASLVASFSAELPMAPGDPALEFRLVTVDDSVVTWSVK